MFEIMTEDSFASAHQLIGYDGPCENLHGHTWKVQVYISGGSIGKLGMLFDFKKAKKMLKDILSEFDHRNLNELEVFKKQNPTAENIAKVIFDIFNVKIDGETDTAVGAIHESPSGTNIEISKVTVWESEKTCATYRL